MVYEKLNNRNYILYAAKHYDNPHCTSMDEFYEDLRRVKYVKKLITRYAQSGELKERLILNHLITLNNVFGPEPLVRIIFLKMRDQLNYIKPFLVLLNICPDVVFNVGKEDKIFTDTIPMDQTIVEALRQI